MANLTYVTKDLDVTDKYESLVKQSLSTNSAYIRAKETIEDLVQDGAIDESQKAEIISNIVGGIVNNITSNSLSTALSWAQAEKEIELKKLELAKQLDILDQEKLVKQAQIKQIDNTVRLARVESKRINGTAIFDDDGNVSSLGTDGKIAKDMALTDVQITKVGKENTLIDQKVKESYAAVHKIIADTYVNYGNYNYTGLADNGITTVTKNHGDFKTLSDTQKDIAIEQAKGYTYNAWANALTGASSMLGTAIAAEYAEFDQGQTGGILLDIILDTARNLKAASTTATDATPGTYT
jgi:hypothetical protein